MARNIDPSTLTTGPGAQADTDPVVVSNLPANKVNRPGDKMSGGLWVSPDNPETALRVTGTDAIAVQVDGLAAGVAIQVPAPTNGVAIQSLAKSGATVLQVSAIGTGKVLEATSANESTILVESTGAPTVKATSNGAFPGVLGLGKPGLSGQGISDGTGVEGVGGNVDGIGVSGTGGGTGAGVHAVGGAAGGSGVHAVGGAAGGSGVHAVGGVAGGSGVYARSSDYWSALHAEAQGTGAGLQAISVDGPGILVAGGNNRTAADLTGGADAPAIQAWAGGYGPTVVAWSGTSGLATQFSTFQAGSSTSALKLNASASTVDGFYVGWKITIDAGADPEVASDWRYVISYNGTTQVAVVEPPFTGTPGNGESYILRAPSTAALIAHGQRSGMGAHVLAGYDTHRTAVMDNVPPSATAFELVDGSAVNSYYVGWTVSVDSQVTRCTGYVGATKVLTVSPALGVAPGVGTAILLLKGQAGLSVTGAGVHDGFNATSIYNGIGVQVSADLPVSLSNPSGKRGHMYLAPSTIGVPSSASAGELWTADDAAKDLYYRDSAGWLNLSALARRVEHFSGHLGFVQEMQGTWNNPLYTISGSNLVLSSLGWNGASKRAYQQYNCSALDSSASQITVGWEIPIPHGFQGWTDIELRVGSSVFPVPYSVLLLDTDGVAATLVDGTGNISNGAIKTITVAVSNGTYEGGKVAILSIKIQPDNATAQLRFYGLTINYRA